MHLIGAIFRMTSEMQHELCKATDFSEEMWNRGRFAWRVYNTLRRIINAFLWGPVPFRREFLQPSVKTAPHTCSAWAPRWRCLRHFLKRNQHYALSREMALLLLEFPALANSRYFSHRSTRCRWLEKTIQRRHVHAPFTCSMQWYFP